MNKKLVASLVSCMVLGSVSVYAANPFSDVDASSWAYQSVEQLANAGIINGYPDGTFKGSNPITRYEMAQMVAKAMANQDKANAEQQAMINRLADEFGNELNTLGVRVAKLENQVGNVKVTGNYRLRYRGSELKNDTYAYGKHSSFDYRARVIFNAKVNDKTDAVVRIQGSSEFGNSNATQGKINLAYVDHHFGKDTTLRVGRQLYTPGLGLMYDDLVDGARLMYKHGKLDVSASYGYWLGGAPTYQTRENTVTAAMVEVKGKLNKHVTLGGMYGRFHDGKLYQGQDVDALTGKQVKSFIDSPYKNIWGLNTNMNFNRWNVFGEWLTAPGVSDSHAWMASLGYGNYDIKKAHTYSVRGQYYYQEGNSPIFSSAFAPAYSFYNQHYVDNKGVAHVRNGFKGFVANVNYVPFQNVSIGAYYGFGNKDMDGNTLGDYWRTDVNFMF